MIKKASINLIVLLLLTIGLIACSKKYEVTFISDGVTYATKEVKEKGLLTKPEDPIKTDWHFDGWYIDTDYSSLYSFDTPVKSSFSLYAKWIDRAIASFYTKTTATIPNQDFGFTGGAVTKPADPVRTGYKFGGWFLSKPGLTWLEPDPVIFPYSITKATTFYAYWEPIDSKSVLYSDGETYFSSLSADSPLIINPLTYTYSHEEAMIEALSTTLYTSDVDWDKAIKEGVASKPGDFSKITSGEYDIDALDYIFILSGATQFPLDSEGSEHLKEGKYDRDNASSANSIEWTYNLRNDVKFEDGTPVTAYTYEYTLKQFLDPVQNNYRANMFYKTKDNPNGYAIINADKYHNPSDSTPWSSVGFKVLSDYSFKVIFSEQTSQSTALGFGDIKLVHPTKYAQSLDGDGQNSSYGTPGHPYISYGSYIIKSWDENAKLVLNKNYDYINKKNVNYKSISYQIVADQATQMRLYEDGKLSQVSLSKEYYGQYAEYPNVKRGWDGYPQYIIINLANSKDKSNPITHPSIMFDVKFRQALLFGFDRIYFANNVYQPNKPSLMPVPLDTKAYIQDPIFYSQSPQHLAILEEFGIDPSSEGYIAERAISLFNEAYESWTSEGNSGVVTVKFLSENDDYLRSLNDHIKTSYERLFGADKFQIEIIEKDKTAVEADIKNWNFDLTLRSVGFGSSTGIQNQYALIAFYGGRIGAANLGLSQPWTKNDEYADYLEEEIYVDLTNTYDYLLSLGDSINDEEQYNIFYSDFLQLLSEYGNKPAGYYQGPMEQMLEFIATFPLPYDGTASEPFSGATEDIYNLVAAFERIFFEHVTLIPTVTRASAILYSSNVVILWPEYSTAFDWGSARYRYLNTDPDFQ